MLSQPNVIYRTRSKENLKAAYKSAGFEKRLPGIKAVPIATNGVPNSKVKVRKGRVVLSSQFGEVEIIPLDQLKLATDSDKYIDSITGGTKPRDAFLIAAGKHWIEKPVSSGNLKRRVSALMAKYDKGTKGSEKHGGSTYRDWMHSVRKSKTKNQKSAEAVFSNMEAAKKNHRAAYKKKTKAQRKRK